MINFVEIDLWILLGRVIDILRNTNRIFSLDCGENDLSPDIPFSQSPRYDTGIFTYTIDTYYFETYGIVYLLFLFASALCKSLHLHSIFIQYEHKCKSTRSNIPDDALYVSNNENSKRPHKCFILVLNKYRNLTIRRFSIIIYSYYVFFKRKSTLKTYHCKTTQ